MAGPKYFIGTVMNMNTIANKNIDIRYVKGVGPKKAEIFNKMGLYTIKDLLYYLPRRYEDRRNIHKIKDLKPGEDSAFAGQVIKQSIFTARTGTNIVEVMLDDGTGRIWAVWYNMPFMHKKFTNGDILLFYGTIESQGRLVVMHPAYDLLENIKKSGSVEMARIVPVYPLTKDLTQKYIRKITYAATHEHLSVLDEILPTSVRARQKLVDIDFAFKNIHYANSFENIDMAYRRLVFEEFFFLQIIMALKKRKNKKEGIAHKVDVNVLDEYKNIFDFELTQGQQKCMKEIEKDMSSDKPMYRLLQGDVGSGKTVVAMYAAFLAFKGGYQAVFMAPTEILARQHFFTLSELLMPLGINVTLLAGGMTQEEKNRAQNDISSGTADIIVGTHSVFQKNITYANLGLAVIDEQHKFGVDQRKTLMEKNIKADTLVMTATPIPRSLALTVYGDMDLSSLKEKPKKKGNIVTYWVDEEGREELYKFVDKEIDDGGQIFVVCPRIKSEGAKDLASVESMHKYLKEKIFPNRSIAVVHGKTDSTEKEKIMKDFEKGKINILVATTVVEVGIDVPNASIMIIENAERYGLAQLHQLRGRIGRGNRDSYCVLVADAATESAKERLQTISGMDDGFKIAETDLSMRGPGEFLGKRQSGLPELRFGNILRDYKIMEQAREEAFDLIEDDP
ncbi:MAG: ATP-dependent DNA helicase RecG, partial [Candidatus Omnitrophica bacterium]|nr:ATP-dependent DNA helicase RecG [Candidatus Omnitrophota bacterium]